LQPRALADARTVTVYQAYSHAIADAALMARRFVAAALRRARREGEWSLVERLLPVEREDVCGA